MDHTCWDLKDAAHFALREAQLSAKHKDLVRVSEQQYKSHGDVLGYTAFQRVSKRTEGAKPALIVDGHARGTLIYITGVNHERTKAKASPAKLARDAGKEPTKAQLRQELADKREALQRRRTLLAWSALSTVLERCAPERDAELAEDTNDGDPVVILEESEREDVAGDAGGAAETDTLPDLPAGVIPKVPALTAWARRSPPRTHLSLPRHGVGLHHQPGWPLHPRIQGTGDRQARIRHPDRP